MTTSRDYNELPIMDDLRCRRGDDINRPFRLTINGEPVNLTSCTLTLRLSDGNQFTLAPDDAELGLFTLWIAPEVTQGAEHGRLLYSILFEAPPGHAQFPNGATKTLREGTIDLSVTL